MAMFQPMWIFTWNTHPAGVLLFGSIGMQVIIQFVDGDQSYQQYMRQQVLTILLGQLECWAQMAGGDGVALTRQMHNGENHMMDL